MYISKRGREFVLVATLLLMLSPLRCARTHPMLREEKETTPSSSHVYLYNRRHSSYVSLHPRKGRRYTVAARCQERNDYSLLRLTTAGKRQQKMLINIYNEEAKRYICFNKRGRVRTASRVNEHGLSCSFHEKMARGQSNSTLHYVANERRFPLRRNRLLSFCGRRRRAILQRRSRRHSARKRMCYTFIKTIIYSDSLSPKTRHRLNKAHRAETFKE